MTKSEWTGVARNRLIAVLLLAGACFAVGLVVLGLVAVQTWEYTNSVSFCSNACHDVHPEEPVAYEDSYHARVKCVECHMGRVSTLRAIALKSTHSRHLLAVLSGRYERPLESASMRPANETCERCHSPSTFHDDTARVIQRFLPNEDNSEKRTYLLLKTGTGAQEPSNGYGIHWHISNQVEYIAADDHKQEIRWIRASLPDGRTVEYNDVLNPLSPEEIDRAEKRVMDCVDCHNRIGHAYLSPEKLIDKALTEGRLSPALPFAKKEMFAVLAAEYGDQAEALEAADSIRGRYQEAYPEVAAAYAAEIEQAVQLAKELIPRLVFKEPGVTWQSFSDNIGHKTTPGCFRCHDGKHVSQEGESIRLKCGLCHGIPVTVDASDGPPEMPIAARQEPLSHLETSFVSDHRFTASESCVECHGVVDFGEDDSSFCANSACHGLAWPMVDLDAIFAHPIRLEGGHAGVECYRCHNGVGEISYACSNCHEPLAEPHYGPQCQDCHIAGGFELASTEGFLHPMALEGRHDNLGCGACHSTAKVLASECSTCHLAPQDHLAGSCNTCHTPDGWVESALTLVARGPDIPHVFSESDGCLLCHDPEGQNWPASPSHRTYGNVQCSLCHTAGSGAPIAVNHDQIPGLLQGEHAAVDCVQCHEGGVFQGTSQSCYACHQGDDRHGGQFGQECAECHTPNGWQGASIDHNRTRFPLTGRHSGASCVQCHANGSYAGTPQRCYACHQGDDRHAGQFGQECAECHTPNGWQGASIDHSRTRFPLTGRHSGASCAQCHTNGSYAGTPQRCYACHQGDDRHGGQFGQECAECHTPNGWQGASIDHNRTRFPLTGRHSGASCAQCHANGSYAGTPQRCYACHQGDDRHGGQFGQECAECHTPNGWQGASIDHNRTRFPLTGRHSGVSCAQCHANGSYAGTPQRCYACHQGDDRHGGQFGQECAECHTANGWQGASIDHSRTRFPLTGRHSGASCTQCHTNGSYAGTPRECSACHGEPAFHAGLLGRDCASCHSTEGWRPAKYEWPHTFPFEHGRPESCQTCHSSSLSEYTCFACHNAGEIDEKHREEDIPDYSNCMGCHPTGEEP